MLYEQVGPTRAVVPLVDRNTRLFALAMFSYCFERRFFHRVNTALRAISDRLFADSFRARALPPFRPPNLPKATAAGFFLPLMVLLERLGILAIVIVVLRAAKKDHLICESMVPDKGA